MSLIEKNINYKIFKNNISDFANYKQKKLFCFKNFKFDYNK